LIGTTPENRRVLVLDRGRVHPFPEGMLLTVPTQVLPFLRTRLLSPFGKARAGLDLILPRRRAEGDESIASFVRRRFGDEVLLKIGAPLLGGVFAGDVESLSIRATFPQLVELEKKHRSLVLGARREMRARAAARGGGPPASVFHSFPGGLAELVEALASAVTGAGATIATGTRVARVEKGESSRWRVHAEGPSGPSVLEADSVVLAMPGYAAAGVLREIDRDMARDLEDVPYVSSVVVGLAYPRSAVAHRLDATGVITTGGDDRPIMAVTFLSSKWAGRAPEDGALFRVFMGGAGREDVLATSDEALISLAEKELSKLVGTRGAPVFARVYRHERASAQPVLGHDQRVARVRAGEAKHPGLFVVGAAMDGVGIPDCVRQATDVAKRVLGG
jgi:oxygen-dependent protoporphyrinogen oxidase